MTLDLGPDDVHVWYARIDDCLTEDTHDRLLGLLSEEELALCARPRLERVRQERIVSKAFVRLALSWYADVSPETWRFESNEFGRPELLPGDGTPPLAFNLAHSGGVVVCGVTLEREIGVDVEDASRPASGLRDIERYLSPAESAHLAALPEGERQRTFFRYWTLKEAYVKARGVGLSLGFKSFTMDLSAQPPRMAKGQDPSTWQFDQREIAPSHVIAVAARRATREMLAIRYREVPDLVDFEP